MKFVQINWEIFLFVCLFVTCRIDTGHTVFGNDKTDVTETFRSLRSFVALS